MMKIRLMRTIGEALTKFSFQTNIGFTKKLHRSDKNDAVC